MSTVTVASPRWDRQWELTCSVFHVPNPGCVAPQILEWFRTIGASYLQRTELGETYAGAKYIQEQHSQFEADARVREKEMPWFFFFICYVLWFFFLFFSSSFFSEVGGWGGKGWRRVMEEGVTGDKWCTSAIGLCVESNVNVAFNNHYPVVCCNKRKRKIAKTWVAKSLKKNPTQHNVMLWSLQAWLSMSELVIALLSICLIGETIFNLEDVCHVAESFQSFRLPHWRDNFQSKKIQMFNPFPFCPT